jgi:hypothetical protein
VKDPLLESLAALEHDQWRAWARTLMETEIYLSDARRRRWERLIDRAYDDLTEEEKEQDRVWARKVKQIVAYHSTRRKEMQP